MADSKFFALYKKLTRSELAAFGAHLAATHGEKLHIRKMYDYIVMNYHLSDKQQSLFEPENVHQAVFSHEPFERVKILNLYYDLHRQLKLFLLKEHFLEDAFETGRYWLAVLSEKGMKERFVKVSENLNAELVKSPVKGVEFYRKSLMAEEIQYYQVEPGKKDHNRNAPLEYLKSLNLYYKICHIKVGCDLATMNKQVKESSNQFDLSTTEILIEQTAEHEKKEHPVLALFITSFQLIKSPDHDKFRQLATLFKQYIDKVDQVDLNRVFSFLQNYFFRLFNNGDYAFLQESFELTQLAFEHNVIKGYGAVSPTAFQNIVNIASKNNQFKWAEKFISEQGIYLDESARKDTVLIARASLDIEQKQFENAYKSLNINYELKDLGHEIRAKMMLLFCGYMRSLPTELLMTTCTNFERYLTRLKNKRGIRIDPFLNFTNVYRSLAQHKEPIEVIQNRLALLDEVSGRSWLVAMIDHYDQ